MSPTPKINNVLLKLQRYWWTTALDLNVCNYTIWLDPNASTIYVSQYYLAACKH